jgi:hypothetical protein
LGFWDFANQSYRYLILDMFCSWYDDVDIVLAMIDTEYLRLSLLCCPDNCRLGSTPSLKGLKVAKHANGRKTDLDTLQARQILPSDFSYGGVACELRTTTHFRANFCK